MMVCRVVGAFAVECLFGGGVVQSATEATGGVMATWTYPGIVRDWHDGDSPHMDMDLGFYVHWVRTGRIYGINAPELVTSEGKAALAAAVAICPPGTEVKVLSHQLDKYGRALISLTLPDGTDFAQRMIDSSNAVVMKEA
jgi:endonuclease YncB( thermonuclease family)